MNVDGIIKALGKFKRPPEYDENGDQCYKLLFFGTKTEYEALKKDLTMNFADEAVRNCNTNKSEDLGDSEASRGIDIQVPQLTKTKGNQ